MKKDKYQSLESLRLHRQAEDRLREKPPAQPGPVSDEEQRRLYHELQVHQIELEMQNEELNRAKEDAEEALAKFVDLYEFAPVGYLTLDPKGTILAVNLTGATFLGADRSQLVGRPFGFFLAGGQSDLFHFLAKVFAGPDELQSCEVTLKTSGKAERYVRLDAQATSYGRECRVALVDITGMRQEELFHLQLECVEGHAIYLLDERGTILNWNPGAERLKGYRAEEIIGKNFSCFYSEKDREDGKPEQELRTAAAEGRFAEECWRIRKDGSGFWADVVLTPLRDEKGHLWGFSKVTHDITDRKKAQEELSFSEARYRVLFEDNPTIVFTLDTKWNILSANPSALSQLGYSKKELEGQSVLKLIYPDDRAAVVERFQLCISQNEVCHWQFRKLCKDGRLLWVEETAQATVGIDGRPVLLVVCQDVTERKRAEEERERLLLQLEAVLENINEAVVITDLAANVVSMNRAALAMYGYRRDEVDVQRPLAKYQETFEFSDLEGHPVSFEHWPLVRAQRGESFVDCELQVLRKDTGKTWIGSYNGSLVRGKSGADALAVITVRDITERKRVEEAFRESEARFHAIFDLAAVGIAQVSLNGHWMVMNQKLSDTLGYSFEELKNITLQQISHPDDMEPHLAHIRRLLAGEVPFYSMEKRYICKNGSILWVNLNVTLVRDTQGKPVYFIAIVENIDKRKRAEQELLESEEKFFKVFSLAPIGMTISTLADGKFIEINEAGERLSGYPRDEVIGHTSAEFSIWNDASERARAVEEVLKNGEVRDREMVMKNKAGEVFWGMFSAVVVEIKGEKHLLSLVSDIAERKRAQEALAESEERFRAMADTAPVLVWISGADSLCTFFNKPWLEFTGRSLEQEQGNGWTEGIHPDDMQGCLDTYLAAFGSRLNFKMEYRLRRADGEYRWLVDTGVPRFLPSGDFIGYIGSCFDITERKQAEEEIRKLNMTLAEKAEELEAFNHTVAHDLRQPLNIINSCCQVIERLYGDQLDADCREHVQMAYNNTLRMDRLIAALLNFSSMGSVEPQKVMTDLSPIALELIGMLQQTEPERQVDLRIAPSVMAHCDANLLRSVLENLLGNAWKYTANREQAVIEFGVREIDGVSTYFVRDNGMGFDQADAGKLFTPFKRLPGTENHSGFGIGLATVERIVRRHGGKVWGEGEPDQGACFFFTLSA